MRNTIFALAFVALAQMTPVVQARSPITVIQKFHENGQLASREQYWHGRKVGLHETWWANGVKRSSAFYLNDAFDGEYRTWYASGRPYELRHFEQGHESGRQQSWTEDGTLFLNYDVRDGRRYGLVNARPCEKPS